MFNVELRCTVGGKPVSLQVFIGDPLTHVIQGIARELMKQTPVPPTPRTIVQTIIPSSKPEPLAVSMPEAARLLGLRPSTIRAMLFRNRIPSVRLGRRVLIPMDAIRRIVNEGIPPSPRR